MARPDREARDRLDDVLTVHDEARRRIVDEGSASAQEYVEYVATLGDDTLTQAAIDGVARGARDDDRRRR